MNIPQEELDKLNESNTDGIFDGNVEEETVEEVEEKVSEPTDKDSVADKARIPYSRFEKVNERAIRAEERLKLLEEQADSRTDSNKDDLTPEEWIELYGDSDVAKKAWALDQKLKSKSSEEITSRVLEEIEKRQTEKQSEVEKNLAYIEDNLSKFEESLGRSLTESEESAILDIQDEFTPKDEKGNYISPLLSPEKAFEVYNLRQGKSREEKGQARRRVVSITGASTDGEGSASAYDNYKPGDTGLWRNKL